MGSIDIINKLLSEIAAGELRAQRALRALQHQDFRLDELNTVLQNKSKLLQDLQERHAELLEVHDYQQNVESLQKQLIKLQEVQYATMLKLQEVDSKVNLQESVKENFMERNAIGASLHSLSSKVPSSSTMCTDEGRINNNSDKEKTKMEEKAERMWEIATRFFTPEEAHFILTALAPAGID